MELTGRKVYVQHDNVDKALRKFKKKIQTAGILQDVQNKETYIKPTTKRKTARSKARQRWRKYVESQQLPPRQY